LGFGGACVLLVAFAVFELRGSQEFEPRGMVVPRYGEDGSLIRPEDFHSWMFVGASIGLGYSEAPSRRGPGMFHNVYTQPEAYQHFVDTGQFPEKTMFALVMYRSQDKGSISRRSFFEGDFVTLEVAVKDHEQFEEGWAYFGFGDRAGLRDVARPSPRESCYDCHAEPGLHDNVFVQYYPILRNDGSQ
jgi:hypothetical protein